MGSRALSHLALQTRYHLSGMSFADMLPFSTPFLWFPPAKPRLWACILSTCYMHSTWLLYFRIAMYEFRPINCSQCLLHICHMWCTFTVGIAYHAQYAHPWSGVITISNGYPSHTGCMPGTYPHPGMGSMLRHLRGTCTIIGIRPLHILCSAQACQTSPWDLVQSTLCVPNSGMCLTNFQFMEPGYCAHACNLGILSGAGQFYGFGNSPCTCVQSELEWVIQRKILVCVTESASVSCIPMIWYVHYSHSMSA